jgi:hypothetical protein
VIGGGVYLGLVKSFTISSYLLGFETKQGDGVEESITEALSRDRLTWTTKWSPAWDYSDGFAKQTRLAPRQSLLTTDEQTEQV